MEMFGQNSNMQRWIDEDELALEFWTLMICRGQSTVEEKSGQEVFIGLLLKFGHWDLWGQELIVKGKSL